LPLLAPAYFILTLDRAARIRVLMNLRGIPIRRRSLYVAAVLTLPASLPSPIDGVFTMQPLFDGVSWREALFRDAGALPHRPRGRTP
jgi:hypothetical protein